MRVDQKLFSPKDPYADAKLLYTRRNLHQIQNMFAPRTFYTRKPSTRATLYTSLLYTKDFYTRRLLHQNPFTPQGPCIYTSTVYTKNALRRGNLNQTTVAQKLLHQTTFHNTEFSIRNRLHQKPFDTRSFYTGHMYTMQLSHQKAFPAEIFSPKNFYSKIL